MQRAPHSGHSSLIESLQLSKPPLSVPRQARTFLLVGDHNQLPPLVANAEARRAGLDRSLFRSLSEGPPTGVFFVLKCQHRSSSVLHCMCIYLATTFYKPRSVAKLMESRCPEVAA